MHRVVIAAAAFLLTASAALADWQRGYVARPVAGQGAKASLYHLKTGPTNGTFVEAPEGIYKLENRNRQPFDYQLRFRTNKITREDAIGWLSVFCAELDMRPTKVSLSGGSSRRPRLLFSCR